MITIWKVFNKKLQKLAKRVYNWNFWPLKSVFFGTLDIVNHPLKGSHPIDPELFFSFYSDIKNTSGSINSTLNNDDTNPTINKDSSKFSTFQEISLDDVLKLCGGISDKSCSLDIIPAWLFKKCLPELISVVHFIVNESLKTGVFTTAFKTAVVRPSLKKHNLDTDILGNYRPIRNLTYISKLLEKVGFLDNEKLFSEFQSGYRKSHSCETPVLKIHIMTCLLWWTNVTLQCFFYLTLVQHLTLSTIPYF